MVNYKFQCKNCNRKFKNNKSLSHHKCDTIPVNKQTEKCLICKNDIKKTHFKRHYERCQSKEFMSTFGEIIQLIFKLIIIFNKKMKMWSYFGDNDDKKIYLYDNFSKNKQEEISKKQKIESVNLKKNMNIIENEYKKELDNDIYFKDKYYEKNEMNKKKSMIIPAIEIEKRQYPGISVREVVFRFLKNNKYDNQYITKRINRRYKHKDYPTDDEMKIFPDIYDGILRQRGEYSNWIHKFNDFYYMLEKYKQDKTRTTFRCDYCKKMIFDEKRHLINCIKGKESYNNDKTQFIENYIKKFYMFENFSISDVSRIIEKSKNLEYDVLITNIRTIITKYRNYLQKLNKEYEEGIEPEIDNEYYDKYKEYKQQKSINVKEKVHRKENFYEGKKILQEVIDEFDQEQRLIEMKENIDDKDNQELEQDDNENDNENDSENDSDNEDKNDDNKNDELDKNRTLVNKTDNEDNDEESKEEINNENKNEIQKTSNLIFKPIVNNNNRLRDSSQKFINNMNTRIHNIIHINKYSNQTDDNKGKDDNDINLDDLFK